MGVGVGALAVLGALAGVGVALGLFSPAGPPRAPAPSGARGGRGSPSGAGTSGGVPSRASFPSAATTGPRLARSRLRVVRGTVDPATGVRVCTITAGGATIARTWFACLVRVKADGVRLVDDYLPGAGGHGNILVQLPGYTGLLLAHSEVGPDQPSDYDEGVMFAHFTAVADNIHDVDDAFFIGAGGGDGSAPDSPRFGRDVRIQDCYIHDLIRFSARHHNDGVQFVSGADVLIEHNWIDLGHQEDSAVFLAEDVGAITGVRVVGNYLDGGSFTIFSLPGPCPPGPGGRPDCARRRPPPSGVTVADNWFGPDALYGLLYQYGDGLAWSGNRMYPSGTPVAYPAVTGNPAQRSQITLPVPTAPG